MALLNPRFEEAGEHPGEAAYWTLVTYVTAERIAGFGPEPYHSTEDFERWSDLWLVLDDVGIALAFFNYATNGYEDFEKSWDNSSYYFELPAGRVIVAIFGDSEVESMEDGWLTEPYARWWDEVNSETGEFDGSPYENFEGYWNGNEFYVWSWDDVTAQTALFDGGTNPVEMFDQTFWPEEEI
jgi:hypothetical protein